MAFSPSLQPLTVPAGAPLAVQIDRAQPGYPARLCDLPVAPERLWVKGRLPAPHERLVAMVGSRAASGDGCAKARALAADLGRAGFGIVSGGAFGIDAAAHEGALAVGAPTYAVLGCGIDVVYPDRHVALFARIAGNGGLLSEYPPGTQPRRGQFPARNRIIAALAEAVIVVEAAARSGSLTTARRALDYGREVFAVPGSPLDPRCRGCNDLLRNGATLTENAADIVGQLGPLVRDRPPPRGIAPPQPHLPFAAAPRLPIPPAAAPIGDQAALELLVERLGPTPVAVDELVRQCQLSAAAVATLLLELELAGRIERHPGNLVSLR